MPPHRLLNWNAPWLRNQPLPVADYDAHAAVYDLEYAAREMDLDFWVRATRCGPVLELGCGTGRLTTQLARTGHQITGVDSSKPMLERATQRMSGQTNVTLIHADVRALPCRDGSFGTVLAPFAVFNYLLSLADQLAAATELKRVLRSGGHAIVDLAMLPLGTCYTIGNSPLRLERADQCDDASVICYGQSSLDRAWNVCRYTQILDVTSPHNTARYVLRHHWHIYTLFEACYLFMLAGFAVHDVVGDYQLGAFTGTSRNMILFLDAGQQHGQ
jgi:SAM-dependent methyltransferase